MRWHRGHGRRRRGRPLKPVTLSNSPALHQFRPFPSQKTLPIYLDPAELEAFRLVDFEGLTQEEAGTQMDVSRGTIWRLLQKARKKTVQALIEARPLHITH